MVKGADAKGTGLAWDVARQDNDEYLAHGWIQVDRRDKTSYDYTDRRLRDARVRHRRHLRSRSSPTRSATARPRRRSRSGRATGTTCSTRRPGYLAARSADGSFPAGPAFQRSSAPGIGQDGWEEGNSIQYTWSVPQDLRGLFNAMGGNSKVVGELDHFFTHLNTSRYEPYDWAGDEPALGIPWEYDYAGAPSRTQDVVRRIVTELYAPTPNGEPGNDDLGAMSSWYVWAAIGMYPETPGSGDLVAREPAVHTREHHAGRRRGRHRTPTDDRRARRVGRQPLRAVAARHRGARARGMRNQLLRVPVAAGFGDHDGRPSHVRTERVAEPLVGEHGGGGATIDHAERVVSGLVDHHRQACDGLTRVASQLDEQQWELPTPCSEWDARRARRARDRLSRVLVAAPARRARAPAEDRSRRALDRNRDRAVRCARHTGHPRPRDRASRRRHELAAHDVGRAHHRRARAHMGSRRVRRTWIPYSTESCARRHTRRRLQPGWESRRTCTRRRCRRALMPMPQPRLIALLGRDPSWRPPGAAGRASG